MTELKLLWPVTMTGHSPKIILSLEQVIIVQHVKSFVQFPSATNASIVIVHATDLNTEAEVLRNVLYILYYNVSLCIIYLFI